MGNNQTKGEKGTQDKASKDENKDLLEAVDSLPKVETLQSVKKPKGPKGRKPPSRTFLQKFASYFQVKPQNTKVNAEIRKEPSIVLDLNVIEKQVVLENVTKGRPPPPGNRRRPARVRNTPPRQDDKSNVIKVVELEADEVIKTETKLFLKPPVQSQSKWKTIDIKTVLVVDVGFVNKLIVQHLNMLTFLGDFMNKFEFI